MPVDHLIQNLEKAISENQSTELDSLLSYAAIYDLNLTNEDYFELLRWTVCSGHLLVLNHLLKFWGARDQLSKPCNYLLAMAARHDHGAIITRLLEFKLVRITNAHEALCCAAKVNNLENREKLFRQLLVIPPLFYYAESESDKLSDDARDGFERFIGAKLREFRERRNNGNEAVVHTQQEARICFLMLHHFLKSKTEDPDVLSNIQFLYAIPSVQAYFQLPFRDHFKSELFEQAIDFFKKLPASSALDTLPNLSFDKEKAESVTKSLLDELAGAEKREHQENRLSIVNEICATLALKTNFSQAETEKVFEQYKDLILKKKTIRECITLLSALVVLEQFKTKVGEYDAQKNVHTPIDAFVHGAIKNLSVTQGTDYHDMLIKTAKKHFREDHPYLRIIADICMCIFFPIGIFVMAAKKHLTGNSFFYFTPTKPEQLMQEQLLNCTLV